MFTSPLGTLPIERRIARQRGSAAIDIKLDDVAREQLDSLIGGSQQEAA